MFYRLSCGCIVLPVEKLETGWRVIDIERCDGEHDAYWPHVGGERIYPFEPEGQVGYRKIEDGAKLTPEKEQALWGKLRSLVNDGYRFREVRRALDPVRDIRVAE